MILCNAPPSNGGPCRRDPIDKWTFVKSHKNCVELDYFGCPDTKNLFDSKEECQKACF
ncbi:kunitz-type U1-aranetoxin-Av1a [Drosophila ficusphila]|uniref:kunitz-type U1-aranetoxin-Av1a n=1 Tax=Drosophila ficusphila TaxID=30025 RepID=UPI0007E7B52B|nr:kunitz-type U1-aranetoxin-Av1a [Drosophila ficusphila]